MRIRFLILVLVCAAAAAARAAEPGRKAEVFMLDGSSIQGILLGYADGKFHVQALGKEQVLEADAVDRIKFGPAVGQTPREALEPPKYQTTAPAATGRPEDRFKRALDEGFKKLDLQQLMRLLWFVTGRFQDPERLQRTESALKTRIAATPEPELKADKNLRLALATVYAAQKKFVPAGEVLAQLKRDHPDDVEIQGLTTFGLMRSADRWKSFDPVRLPKRPPGPRSGRDGEHGGRPPEGDRGGPRPPDGN